MGKKNLIREGTEEEFESMRAIVGQWNETYAMNMLQLQETCGLTYREARAYLIPYRENTFSMATELGIGAHAIYNLKRKAKEKIEASGYTIEEIFGDYVPVDKGPIMVSSIGTLDDLVRLRRAP